MGRMIGILAFVCFCSALILGVANRLTAPAIAEQMSGEEKAALQSVLPEADAFEARKTDSGEQYYVARAAGNPVGYCLIAESQGYSSVIRMMIGLSADGAIRGVKVLSQQETPGLGTRMVEVRQGETAPWFLEQFKGKNATTVELKDIDAITGATISSRAVVDGIRNGTNEFMEKLR